MPRDILLITPPFTQLNTPYPGTVYLKGFLKTQGISSFQSDLGIETILDIFSKPGLKRLFEEIAKRREKQALLPEFEYMFQAQAQYLHCIESGIKFLQNKVPNLAHLICSRNYLPEGKRFEQIQDLEWSFGSMGIQDQAKHLVSLFLDDLSDLIKAEIDSHFGFSRYAERLGQSANSFDNLAGALAGPVSYVDEIYLGRMEKLLVEHEPKILALSIPFPGNLYAGFRCAQLCKEKFPEVKVALGGGFANTELRSVTDTRVFEYLDFICLDDGERPILQLIKYVKGEVDRSALKRCLLLENAKVEYINNEKLSDFKQSEVGTPSYEDLWIDRYISVVEMTNPMHRLWNDGRWNKLTMAHGCYWGKCTFCDISLDYIKIYESAGAKLLADRMEELMEETGEHGFHFVDEAAPPSLMKALALEILKRGLSVSWWTNVRFEKRFDADLCRLLAASGCIGISAGLEVASNRLLELIQKGVTVEQVAAVSKNFTEAGIMVHAYLMYGFPTQTDLETIDSLEMVRQLFETGVIQSGFWHQFAMTAHSPVGMQQEKFEVASMQSEAGSFANNDLPHEDPSGADHQTYSEGLRVSLYNYMHGVGFDLPLQEWFDFGVPQSGIAPDHIKQVLNTFKRKKAEPHHRLIFLDHLGKTDAYSVNKDSGSVEMIKLQLHAQEDDYSVKLTKEEADFFIPYLIQWSAPKFESMSFPKFQMAFEDQFKSDFNKFWFSSAVQKLLENGLLLV